MKIFSKFPTVNISKNHFWLVICIAKNLICTTLKMIFFFLHPQIPDFQILSYHNKPYINGKIMYKLMTELLVQGHTWGASELGHKCKYLDRSKYGLHGS